MQIEANAWTANQRKFILWLATPSEERFPLTQKALAAEMGVHETTLVRWGKLPEVRAEVQEIIKDSLGDALHDVVFAFKKQAKKGSFPHQKMYFEMLNLYTPKQDINGTLEISGNVNIYLPQKDMDGNGNSKP